MSRAVRKFAVVAAILLAECEASAAAPPRYHAVAFDYFVLFDPGSVVPVIEQVFPGRGGEIARAWRTKQFEYGFLRSITGRHADFLAVAGDALDYTVEAMHLELSAAARARLVDAYLALRPWPDTVAALRRLKAAGVRVIALANFGEQMLRANADRAGITDLFDAFVSTEVNHTFKPDPRAYALGLERLHLGKGDVVFAAFGGWDAYGARTFGYPTCWVNRLHLPVEHLGNPPDRVVSDLGGLLELVLDGR